MSTNVLIETQKAWTRSGKLQINLSNPVIIYTLLWLTVLWLVSLRLTVNLLELNDATIALVLSNVASFWTIYFFVSAFLPKSRFDPHFFYQPHVFVRLRVFVRRLLLLWFVGSVIEIVLAGGVPIVWYLVGTTKTYVDFGVPTLHGLVTSFYLFSVTALFLDYSFRRNKKVLLVTIALLAWPIIELNRGIMMWALTQIVGVYLMINRLSLRVIMRGAVGVVVVMLVFGVVGDIRTGGYGANIALIISPDAGDVFRSLPSGFHWAYLYTTAPLNNIIGGINSLKPTYSFYYSATNMLPTIVRTAIYNDVSTKYFVLVNEAFNTSTFYDNYLRDFGVVGAVLAMSILQLILLRFYYRARRGQVWALLAYAILFQAMVLSVFTDSFTTWAVMAQVILAVYFGRVCRSEEMSRQRKIQQPRPLA